MNASAIDRVSERLDKDRIPAQVRELVLAAFGGTDAVDRLLADGVTASTSVDPRSPAPASAYLTRLDVEGFRGIGPRTTLRLAPGAGLTLVIGRNGSGKSSFAEAFEVLLTGDNQRWSRRSAVWREGWENLHHADARLVEATLAIEGLAGETTVTRSWAAGANLDDGVAEVQPHGRERTTLKSLGWDEALVTHRPFLSYSELGAMLDEGPTKLHDAVAMVLGLDDLASAEKVLRDNRLRRAKAEKIVLAERDQICALLDGVDDERARRAVASLRLKRPDLSVLNDLILDTGAGQNGDALGRLRRITALEFPPAEQVDAISAEILAAQEALHSLAGTNVDRLLRTAELLEQALAYRETTGATACPVCATPSVLTESWAAEAAAQAREQRAGAQALNSARQQLTRAQQAARSLFGPVPAAVNEIRDILDVSPVIDAWRGWLELRDEPDPGRLAASLRGQAATVRTALAELAAAAQAEIDRREDLWRPVALTLAAWLERARDAQAGVITVPDLKKAEDWLKKAGVAIRNERFAPIADEALAIWRLLRQNSNVELGRIEFEGAGVRRKISLDVTVDGVDGAALGVMSQGELHSLALSLFFPRATLPESPFRFVVIDDPVQSMDPSKVDGLARVLQRAATSRQVIVFTHDDRLYEAVRRLGISANVLEVARREGSIVEVREALTPVDRHLEDARALTRAADLPSEAAARVVPSFCRMALEAAAIECVRRRRIGRGEPHADVEELLGRVNRLTVFMALALFDDGNRGGDVLGLLNRQFGNRSATLFKAVNTGAHQPIQYDLRDLVRDTGVLARQIVERV